MYNPAFKLQHSKEYILTDKHAIETKYATVFARDTFNTTYTQPKTAAFVTFGTDTAYYNAILKNKDSISLHLEQSSKFIKDTIIA